jgi:6-oxo-cyclohex-1-ene-carbonyl-CoA hydrolase
MIGCEQAMVSGLLCEPFSAHKAYRLGVIGEIVPALKVDGKFVANPTVTTDRYLDEYGRIVHGEFKTGAAAAEGHALLKRGTIDLSLLDEKVEALCTKLLYTFPECTTKTVEELRKPKLVAWNANKENSRDWLALNMVTEGRAGFRAFNEGTRETGREIDFVALRRALAANTPWSDELTESIMPRARS